MRINFYNSCVSLLHNAAGLSFIVQPMYLRGFEATGLDSRLSKDMQPVLIVLMLSIVEFSQALRLVSNDQIRDLDDDPR